MGEFLSYDIYVLGLQDPYKAGRHKFAGTMERLTGRLRDEFEESFPEPDMPMFKSLDAEKAQKTVDSLSISGILVEVRPTKQPPMDSDSDEGSGTQNCPACNSVQPSEADECAKCGVVFKKYERELLLKMQKEHTLEQAMTKAMQVREEWLHRATQFLEKKPLAKDSAKEFAAIMLQDEVPFLRLNSAEGPLLMTSRRLISEDPKNNTFTSIPYEMVAEVDFGGGPITTKKSKSRLQLTFHTALPIPPDEAIPKKAWHLDKESTFDKDVVFDWGYARNFLCGSCGERELDYRTENSKVRCRCMHCATDHEIDLAECVAVPLVSE